MPTANVIFSGGHRRSGLEARDDDAVKRSTAVHRLTEIASELERAKGWPGPAIVAGYAFGELIDATGDVERSTWRL